VSNGWLCLLAVSVTLVVGCAVAWGISELGSMNHQAAWVKCLRADLTPAQCDVIVGPDRWK
jgi:hypothetical protein